MNELYELRKLHQSQPEQVQALLSAPEPITRERLAELRLALRPPDVTTSSGESVASTRAGTAAPGAHSARRVSPRHSRSLDVASIAGS
jgi:hypothetical protein